MVQNGHFVNKCDTHALKKFKRQYNDFENVYLVHQMTRPLYFRYKTCYGPFETKYDSKLAISNRTGASTYFGLS